MDKLEPLKWSSSHRNLHVPFTCVAPTHPAISLCQMHIKLYGGADGQLYHQMKERAKTLVLASGSVLN